MGSTARFALIVLPAAAILLTLHAAWILHPQIADLQRKIADPKFAGTAHLAKLQFCFGRLRRRFAQLQRVILLLGGVSLVTALSALAGNGVLAVGMAVAGFLVVWGLVFLYRARKQGKHAAGD